jgi:hypothetical protein
VNPPRNRKSGNGNPPPTVREPAFDRARSDQHRRLATRRAVARANGLDAEITSPREADCGRIGDAKGFSSYLMASADAEELGYARIGSPGVLTEDGNPGESSSESPEGLMARQEEP